MNHQNTPQKTLIPAIQVLPPGTVFLNHPNTPADSLIAAIPNLFL
jgi:hypothetical protein